MATDGDLEVEKLLVWRTQMPFPNKPRQSSFFHLMGLVWCLRFSFSRFLYEISATAYHLISLHQVVDGQVEERPSRLQQEFMVDTFLKHPLRSDMVEDHKTCFRVSHTVTTLWYARGSSDFISRDLNLLPAYCEMKVVCKFYVLPPAPLQLEIETDNLQPKRSSDKSVQTSSKAPENIETLASDINHLSEIQILTDVTLKFGGRSIRAHKSILAERSMFFRAMFQREIPNGGIESGIVEMPYMDATVLEQMLKFMYSGELEDLTEDIVVDLYEAAHRYTVLSLIAECTYWIKRNLTVENCIKYLKVADSHSDSDLKSATVRFIIENRIVMKSDAWLSFSKEFPVLANEVYQAYVDVC